MEMISIKTCIYEFKVQSLGFLSVWESFKKFCNVRNYRTSKREGDFETIEDSWTLKVM